MLHSGNNDFLSLLTFDSQFNYNYTRLAYLLPNGSDCGWKDFLDMCFERVAPDDVFFFFLTSCRSLRCRVRSTSTTPPQPTIVSLTLPSGNAHPALGSGRGFSAAAAACNNSNNNHRRIVYNIMYVHTHRVRQA